MEVSRKKDLLGKLKMPSKGPSDPMLEMNDDELAMDEAPAPEEGGEEAMPLEGEESPAEESKELEMMPDEDLVKELEKRGFTIEAPEEEAAEEESPSEEAAEAESYE